jgi:hypothetical protein
MAPNTKPGVRLTPLAALLDTVIRNTLDRSLGTYLAAARIPGTDWKSFDDIADDLTAMIAGTRTLNRVSIRTFAENYGIPDTRYVEGRSMPRPVSDDAIAAYLEALTNADRPGVDIDVVTREALDSRTRDRLVEALKDSAEGNTADLGDFTRYADESTPDDEGR